MEKKIAVIKGDGIGPEIIYQAKSVLYSIEKKYGHHFIYTDALMGGCAIDATGVPLPPETIEICKSSDAVLLGAVGGPKWDKMPGNLRPEAGLLGIRSTLGLFANLRPAKLFGSLKDTCPLVNSITAPGIDLIIVRELTGGAYFGEKNKGNEDKVRFASDLMIYKDYEIERICRVAFELARKRKYKVHSVDKANVLESSRLWREICHNVALDYPDVEYSDMYVDNAAMQIIRCPSQFDVIVTGNLFGDILSDEASMLTGSLGMIPSASLRSDSFGLYEPVHGSAPDLEGKNTANPIAAILSAAMMLKYSFNMSKEAEAIENAVSSVLDAGYRTVDIMTNNATLVSCSEMGKLISKAIR